MTGPASSVVESPGRGMRYGWLFAAVWLFYLIENTQALLDQPNMWWRGIGLVALVAFAVTYLYLVSLMRYLRHTRPVQPRYRARAWAGIVVMLLLFGLQVPGAGARALPCL